MTRLSIFLHMRITPELAALISVAAERRNRRPAEFVRIEIEKIARRIAAAPARKPRKKPE